MSCSEHQNILLELRAMKDLWELLVNCMDKVSLLKIKYTSYISALKETGVPQETCKKYEDEYYQEDLVGMGVLVNNFQLKDFPFIRNSINKILAHGNAIGLNLDMEGLHLSSPGVHEPSNKKAPFTIRKKLKQDYEDQLNAYAELMDFLVDQRDLFLDIRGFYADTCKQMEEKGVPVQVASSYHVNCCVSNIRQFNIIIDHLERDYAFLKEPFLVILQSLQEIKPYFNIKYPKSM